MLAHSRMPTTPPPSTPVCTYSTPEYSFNTHAYMFNTHTYALDTAILDTRAYADTLQHRLYTYPDQSGGDRAERMPTTERVGGIPLPNQIRAETPGMHQTKPHPKSSPRASKRRRCRNAQSVQDED